MKYTPEAALGWYFVPVFNLWKPQDAMQELWQASEHPRNPAARHHAELVFTWWFLWVFVGFAQGASFWARASKVERRGFGRDGAGKFLETPAFLSLLIFQSSSFK